MKIITGVFLYLNGVPVANGNLQFKLSQDASASAAQISPSTITIVLDAGGNIPTNTQIWANDELTPGTFYRVQLIDPASAQIVFGPERWVIKGPSPINLNSIPSTQNSR